MVFIIHVYKRKNKQKENLTMSEESAIFKIGDLVSIKHSVYAPFYTRDVAKGVGIILEVEKTAWSGIVYYVQTSDGIWRFSDYELELLNESG